MGGLFEWAAKYVSCIARTTALTSYNRKLSALIDERRRGGDKPVIEDDVDVKAIIADALENAIKDPEVM